MSETIAKIRHYHYEEKRRAKLELLERTIKDGLLANLITQDQLFHKSTFKSGSGFNISPSKSLNGSPLRTSKKVDRIQTLPFSVPRGTLPLSPTNMNASMAMEIPLKQPLDIEFKLNRKLAKQLYIAELKEKAESNRAQIMTEREKDLEKKLKAEQLKQ